MYVCVCVCVYIYIYMYTCALNASFIKQKLNYNKTRHKNNPMDTFSSIRHQFDVEIPREFVELTSILKEESTWKL